MHGSNKPSLIHSLITDLRPFHLSVEIGLEIVEIVEISFCFIASYPSCIAIFRGVILIPPVSLLDPHYGVYFFLIIFCQ